MKLITNNPKFLNYEKKGIEVDYRDVDYLKILETARDLIHMNYEMLTHPLYGSVKPNETIYRTRVGDFKDNLDVNSVTMISEAIETFEKFRKNKETPLWTERVREDFGVIDYDLITNAIERIIK